MDVWKPLVHVTEAHPVIPGRGQRSRHVQVRSNSDPGGCIVLAHVGEQEQHQERAAVRADVHPVLVAARKAAVDVPSVIAGISIDRKPDWRGAAEAVLGAPAPPADKLVKRRFQSRGMRGFIEARSFCEPSRTTGCFHSAGRSGERPSCSHISARQSSASVAENACRSGTNPRMMKPATSSSPSGVSALVTRARLARWKELRPSGRERGWWNPSEACSVLGLCGGASCWGSSWLGWWQGAAWAAGAVVRRARSRSGRRSRSQVPSRDSSWSRGVRIPCLAART